MNSHEEKPMNQHEQDLIARGLARVYKGRLIPVIRGGDETAEPGVLEGSEVGAAAPAAPAEAAAPAAAEPEVDPAAAAAPPEPLTRDEIVAAAREASQEGASEAYRQMVAQAEADAAARQQSTPPELPEWDPYDRDTVLAHIVAAITPAFRQLETAIAPAASYAQQQQAAQEEEQGKLASYAELDKLKPTVGDFDNARAVTRAREIFAANPGIEPAAALKQAAADERAYIDAIEKAALERMGIVAQNHVNAGAEPASAGAAAGEVVTVPRGRKAYDITLRNSLATMGRRPGVGVPTG